MDYKLGSLSPKREMHATVKAREDTKGFMNTHHKYFVAAIDLSINGLHSILGKPCVHEAHFVHIGNVMFSLFVPLKEKVNATPCKII